MARFRHILEVLEVRCLLPGHFQVLAFEKIDNDKDVTKDRNLNTFKMYCKQRKSGVRFPDRKAKIRLRACHCITGDGICPKQPTWL